MKQNNKNILISGFLVACLSVVLTWLILLTIPVTEGDGLDVLIIFYIQPVLALFSCVYVYYKTRSIVRALSFGSTTWAVAIAFLIFALVIFSVIAAIT